jgi:epoxyqueuosine reductase
MKEAIRRRAWELGFDECRFTSADAPAHAEHFRRWLAAGRHGEMAYLPRTAEKRCDPQQVLPAVRCVIVLAASYAHAEIPAPPPAPAAGVVARYARRSDYHEVLGAPLQRLSAFVDQLGGPGTRSLAYVDTGPVLERDLAERAGAGFIGKHTNLLSRRLGNWFFLAEILTTLKLEPDPSERNHCGSCTRCLTACPTRAIVAPFELDARRCISYLTIELKGSIPEDLRPQMENHVFGCDICQDVCPWNGRQPSAVRRQWKEFEPMMVSYQPLVARPSEPALDERKLSLADATTARSDALPPSIQNPESETPNPPDTRRLIPDTSSLFAPPLEALAAMSEADFRRVFRHSPIRRTKYRGWLRNLCVAMGNSGDTRFIPRLAELAAHPEPLVREHAQWALARLQGGCL